MMSYRATGDLQTGEEGNWQSNPLVSDAGASMEKRWISVSPNVWHQAVVGDEDWVVVSFHTVFAHELIEERPAAEDASRTHQRHYVVAEQCSLEKVNLSEKLSQFSHPWRSKLVGKLNGQHVKVIKFHGSCDWHHHGEEDELFLVVKGHFRMEFRDRHVWLEEGEFLIVPHGVEHRAVADEEAHVLLLNQPQP
jgi:mannose-6-phosphate isomerase-like protein (cupin superfamily)